MGATGNPNKHQHFSSAEQEQLQAADCWRNSDLRSTQNLKPVVWI